MHLRKLKATNFRLLQDFEIEFYPDITVLIGPNNSGKSNIVDSLVLTSQWMSGVDPFGPRQGFERIVSQHQTERTVFLEFTFQGETQTGVYSIAFSQAGIIAETARVSDYEVRGTGSGNNLTYTYGPSSAKTTVSYSFGGPPLSGTLIPMRPNELAHLVTIISKVVAVDPFRQVFFQSGIARKPTIASNGNDLATVLHYHYNNDRLRFDSFEQMVRKVLPEIERIETPILDGPQTTVQIKLVDDPQKYNLWQISSGLKDILLLITAIHFSDAGSVIFIEEPENHLHPASQKGLSAMIQEAVTNENKQIILTTHSEVILTQFGTDKTVFVDRERAVTTATPLPRVEPFQVWERMGFEPALLLQALGRAAQVIVVLEGRGDHQTLEPLWGHYSLKERVIPKTSQGGDYREIVNSARALRDALNRFRLPTQVFVLLDGNGETTIKQNYMNSQGFTDETGHVWSEKEVESYLLIPTALHNISGVPLDQVRATINTRPGTAGKDRLDKVLESLGIRGTTNNVIVKNALANCPGEIPGELLEVPKKIRRMLSLPEI